ncbi:MAG: S9 family peptidase [Clostridia bacterium]|nr:S9 family peptidase [Clostridia bacterium]
MAKTRHPFTTENMGEMVYLSDPSWSGDGKSAAFVRCTACVDDGTFHPEAVLLELETGTQTGLGADTRAPRFAPDGSFVSFLQKTPCGDQLMLRTGDGVIRKLTTLRHGIENYALCDNGALFVFEARLWQDEIDSAVAFEERDAQAQQAWEQERQMAPLEITQIDYKRDECKGVRDGSIGVIGTVTLQGKQKLLTSGMPYHLPAVSADGSRVACYGQPYTGARYSREELFVIPVRRGKPKQLTENGFLTADVPPVFTVDGQEIIYPNYVFQDGGMAVGLQAVGVDGKHTRALLDFSRKTSGSGVYGMPLCRTQYGTEKPYFAVSGDTVYFLSMHAGHEVLYKVALAGGQPKKVLETAGSVHEFCVPKGNRILFTGGDTQTIRSLYLKPSLKAEPVCVYDPNPFLKELELGEVTAYDVPSSDGKVSVHGWVCKPAGWKKGVKYPAVLYLHGGPTVCYSEDFWHEVQALSGAGYAVVYCDPRGSTGYGPAYAAEEASWGEEAYDDMMGFLDHAIGLGFIDPERVGITGGSYGGYMTCKIIMKTSRFRAAVGQRVFVNKATSYGTGDIGFYSARASDEKPDVEKWLMQRSRTSIIRDMDRIETPLLLLHGYQDYRCSFEQSEQMFISLHERKPEVPVRLVMFPGENHNVSRTGLLHFQKRHVQEMIDWFDRFLKEGAQ